MSTALMTHPYLDHDGPIAFAHRGGTSIAPENTVAAFDHAVSLGYRYLETDVHRTRDGVLVAFHDADLARTCNVDRHLEDMTWAEVEAIRIDGDHRIPRLDELFERFPDARFNIDAKHADAVEPLARLVEEAGAVDRVLLAGFTLRILRRLRRALGNRLVTNMSPLEVFFLLIFGWARGGWRCAQVPLRFKGATIVNERFIERAHRRNIPVHVWTVDDRAEMERLLDLGVDGIMTDAVETLREVLLARDLWPA